jgi:hypothetical protein
MHFFSLPLHLLLKYRPVEHGWGEGEGGWSGWFRRSSLCPAVREAVAGRRPPPPPTGGMADRSLGFFSAVRSRLRAAPSAWRRNDAPRDTQQRSTLEATVVRSRLAGRAGAARRFGRSLAFVSFNLEVWIGSPNPIRFTCSAVQCRAISVLMDVFPPTPPPPGAAVCLCVLEVEKTESQLEAASSSAAHARGPCSSHAHLRCLSTLHQNACVIPPLLFAFGHLGGNLFKRK